MHQSGTPKNKFGKEWNIMKRTLAMLLAALLLLGLAACGGQPAAEPPKTEEPAVKTDEPEKTPEPAPASSWAPSGTIDFVCPYSAGGGSDVCARTIASVMSDGGYCDANIVVQNQSGASGLVGTSYVYGKKGDNQCIMTYAPGQLGSAIANNSECQWDAVTQICILAFEEQTLGVRSGTYETLDDLIEYSKANPGKVVVGGTSIGNEDHVCALKLNSVCGADITYVTYDSAGDIMTALLGGHIDAGVFNPSESTAQVNAGDVKTLCSFSAENINHIKGFEDVPTAKSLGYDIDFRMFRGIAGAPGMTDEAVAYWVDAFAKVAEDPAWTEDYLAAKGLIPAFMYGDELNAFLQDQYDTYYAVQKELGII